MITPLARLSTSPAIAGALFMVAAGLFFALVNVAIQAATMSYGLASSSAAFWQYLVALLVAVPWIVRSGLARLRTGQPGLHLLRVVLAAAGIQIWVLGLSQVPIWQAIALVMTSPFFVIIGARLFLGETVDPQRWLAVTIGFAGGMIILEPWSERFNAAALYPLAAAALWALASLLTKRLTAKEPADTVAVYLLLLLTPVNLMVTVVDGLVIPAGPALLLIIAAGILTALAQLTLTRAYAAADAAYVQPFDHLKLPLNVVLGWIVFGFMPPGGLWLGATLIVGASLFILRHEAGAELRSAEPSRPA